LKMGRPYHTEGRRATFAGEFYSRAVSFVDSFDFAALRGN